MANAPFSGDFESLARQYWNTWNELLGRGGGFDGWGLSGGLPPGLGGMDPGSYDWYQRMQRLAADFSGGGSAADVARAWRDMLGGQGSDPFAGMLHSMHGGLAGGEWLEQMRPLLDMLLRPVRQQSAEWLQRPAFGPAREHQERLQALALAWQEWEERNEAFTALLAHAGQAAFERFERLLQEHDAPGKRLETARALFDLWIDAAEDAWAEIALSDEYRHAYAEMTNALMRVRLRLQREVEQFGALLGLPGRGELDALHRKVADLERTLHASRRSAKAQAAQASPVAGASAAEPATNEAVAKKKGPAKAAAAKRPARGAGASTSAKKVRKPATRTAASPAPSVEVVVAPKTVRGKARSRKPAAASAAKARSAGGKRAAPAAAAPAARSKPAQPAKTRRAAPAKPAPARRTPEAPRPAAAEPARKAASRRAPVQAAAKRAPQASTATARKAKVVKAGAARAPSPAVEQPPAKVVSMKDWVSRNLAAAQPDAGRGGGKRKGRSR